MLILQYIPYAVDISKTTKPPLDVYSLTEVTTYQKFVSFTTEKNLHLLNSKQRVTAGILIRQNFANTIREML